MVSKRHTHKYKVNMYGLYIGVKEAHKYKVNKYALYIGSSLNQDLNPHPLDTVLSALNHCPSSE